MVAAFFIAAGAASAQSPVLAQFLETVAPADLAPGADGFGPLRDDLPVAPVMRGADRIGWAFITSDFVGTTGYSGKPIHTMVAVDDGAQVIGVKLVKHSEPIVLIGIPESRMVEMVAGYVGLDLVAEALAGGSAHDLNIISGATVTVMVIDDNIVRAGLRVARALGLGGLGPDQAEAAPPREIAEDAAPITDWAEGEGDGTIRRLVLTVGEINEAFDAHDDLRAAARPLPNEPETVFIDMQAALVSVPSIGLPILGAAEYGNVETWLEEGDSAIAIAGLGIYSFKGSGYVRGGIFDRIQLIQDDISVRFRDRQHRRTTIALEGAPDFTEMDLFRIPADSGFDPARPFRIQLLVHRDVSALDKAFLTYDLGYQLPERYLAPLPAPEPAPAPAAPVAADLDEAAAQAALWQRVWDAKRPQIAVVVAMLGVLTAAFFFQDFFTRSERAVRIFRLSFLTVTLVVLGWMWNAQLSVVNILALFASLRDGFSWQAFMLDPLTFILWFSVAAALIFWGRGAYCGWLCPFGALQELTNQIARKLSVPQITVPWFIHERAWAVKYMIFLGLFGVSLMSLDRAEHLAEVEPFKTAIILNFQRSWPFLLYVGVLLGAGLFIERFYCRYLCPLGAALAIPARLRMFDWLKRYKECGNPCQTCAKECFVQAIHPEGQINPNECLNCMHCQVLYHSETKCPVVIKRLKRRKSISDSGVPDLGPRAGITNHPNLVTKGV
ncbi:MAG: 4Fe-4S binding protein [Paracoccus sp. (in: a-proteobacteria)]|nr:4Fe-4S binding protein [Paracoccus sp. (in: a-proteobacteria)]